MVVPCAACGFDKQDHSFGYGDLSDDEDVDALEVCRRAEKLFERYQLCANRKQVETICANYLRSLEATKVTGNGHNYFVPGIVWRKLTLLNPSSRR